MKDTAMIIVWDRPIPGKEKIAIEMFATAMSYFEAQKKKGMVTEYEPFLIGPHGGTLNGFVIVRGESDKLGQIRTDDEFLKLVTQCDIHCGGFGVLDGYYSSSLANLMDLYRRNI